MKRISYIIASAAVLFSACEKEQNILPAPEVQNDLVTKSFTVSAPNTKTSLDGLEVIWSEGDEINVIEVDRNGNFVAERDFILDSGAGTSSAVFVGEVASTDNTFYAIYPNIKLNTRPSTVDDATAIDLKKPNTNQTAVAVENGFDSKLSIMTAVCNNNSFSFRHAVAFLKLTFQNDEIASIKISSNGDARIFGRAAVVLGTGSPSAVNGASSESNYITLSPSNGCFVKNSFYLLPINIKPNKDLGKVTLTATDIHGVESSLSTSLSGLKPEAGVVYNIGSPVFNFDATPVLTLKKDSITDISADEASLTLYSAYELIHCTDSDVTVSFDGTVVTTASISNGDISYSVSQNAGPERSGWIGLKLGDGDVQYITVTQAEAGAAVADLYYFYIKDNGSAFNSNNRFSHSSISVLSFSSSECGGPFNVESTEVNNGFKLNSGAYVSFTTSSSVTATVTFYYTTRKSGDISGGRIKITPTSPEGEAMVFGSFNPFGTPSSTTVTLDAETTYKIERDNKELGLILVKLSETPIQ